MGTKILLSLTPTTLPAWGASRTAEDTRGAIGSPPVPVTTTSATTPRSTCVATALASVDWL